MYIGTNDAYEKEFQNIVGVVGEAVVHFVVVEDVNVDFIVDMAVDVVADAVMLAFHWT